MVRVLCCGCWLFPEAVIVISKRFNGFVGSSCIHVHFELRLESCVHIASYSC